MKIYLRHTRDQKVMNIVKTSADNHITCNSDAIEMGNAITMRTHSRSFCHNTLARLEDEIAMNSTQLFRNYMKSFNEMNL